MSFAAACGVADASRAAACEAVARRMRDEDVELVRIGWCDTHGILRGKTLTAAAVPRALASGIGLVSTICSRTRPTAPRIACSSPAPPTPCPASASPTI
jgi:glutamine synthetase